MTVKAQCNQVHQKSRAAIKTKTTDKQDQKKVIEISSLKASDVSEVKENSCDTSGFFLAAYGPALNKQPQSCYYWYKHIARVSIQ